jgi:hypothetical protein
MTTLSPAAQAVIDAYGTCDSTYEAQVNTLGNGGQRVAAALRAVADQVVPHLEEPDWGACNNGHCDIELYTDHQRKRAQLLAIAAELEAQP